MTPGTSSLKTPARTASIKRGWNWPGRNSGSRKEAIGVGGTARSTRLTTTSSLICCTGSTSATFTECWMLPRLMNSRRPSNESGPSRQCPAHRQDRGPNRWYRIQLFRMGRRGSLHPRLPLGFDAWHPPPAHRSAVLRLYRRRAFLKVGL